MAMITVKAIFDDGDEITTRFNGSKEEAEAYYLGTTFNLGTGTDRLVKCVKVEVIGSEMAPILKPHADWHPKTLYKFNLTAVRSFTLKDGSTPGIWSRWDSADGRFTVCCEDVDGRHKRHSVSIYPHGYFRYQPEIYTRNNDDTGNTACIVVRPGHDQGGLIGLEQIDAYIRELAKTRKAVEAIQFIFFDNWAETKASARLARAPDMEES